MGEANGHMQAGVVVCCIVELVGMMCITCLMFADVSIATPAYVMLLCVCVARVWLWAFDLAHTQAMQVRE